MTTQPSGMLTVLAAAVLVVASSHVRAASSVPSQGETASGVTGTWTLSVNGGDHVVPMGLVLAQDGQKLTGTLMAQGKEVPLEGELGDGRFTLTATVNAQVHDNSGHGSGPLKITGKLLEDGTMAGELAGPKGGIPWTAERLKKRK